jgi:hypothetical protein
MSKLTDLIEEMDRVRGQLDALDEVWKPLQKRYDELRLGEIPAEMAAEDITSIKGGFGRCTLQSDLHVSAPNKILLHDWLKDTGNGALIIPTVNAQTLKAFCKEQMGKGAELPATVLNINPFSRAVIYKV